MIKEEIECKDLKGRVINQTRKSSRSVEIDGNSKFCGHRFMLHQKLYGDKKCIYCAKWFHWSQEDSHKWVKARNVDNTNLDKVLEPLHCGNSHCSDYHQRYLKHQEKMAIEQAKIDEFRMMECYKQAVKVGLAV